MRQKMPKAQQAEKKETFQSKGRMRATIKRVPRALSYACANRLFVWFWKRLFVCRELWFSGRWPQRGQKHLRHIGHLQYSSFLSIKPSLRALNIATLKTARPTSMVMMIVATRYKRFVCTSKLP